MLVRDLRVGLIDEGQHTERSVLPAERHHHFLANQAQLRGVPSKHNVHFIWFEYTLYDVVGFRIVLRSVDSPTHPRCMFYGMSHRGGAVVVEHRGKAFCFRPTLSFYMTSDCDGHEKGH